ncbi:hypothetical protein A9Q89_00395 [Gammaproteobacteria bacterium 53_120_T64]|nr:hypothetical protein A9Q89_00395 [Gammaproteobacteria bacterium 53_120_T64]
MDTTSLRHHITQAKLLEEESGQLAAQLSRKAPSLHHAIQMPLNNAVTALLDFVVRYTEHVPQFVDVLSMIGSNANCSQHTEAVVNACTDVFDTPVSPPAQHNGLTTLMAQAYIAHRVIEEVNDHYVMQCHEPLIPMDMTRSNLIIHQLIGEPEANHLDLIAQDLAEQLERDHLRLDSGALDQNASREIAWGIEVSHWPCLTDTLAVNLSLGQGSSNVPNLH